MELRNYEVIMITDGSLTDAENGKAVTKFEELIKREGGKVAAKGDWGRRKLAYEINEKRNGIYNFMFIQGNGHVVAELQKQMGYDEQVLKAYVTAVKDLKKAQDNFAALKADPYKNAKLIKDVIGA